MKCNKPIIILLKNSIICCVSVVAFLNFSCSSSIIEKGAWEGIRDNTLRVYVMLDIPEEMNPSTVSDRMTELLIDAGKKRAELLLAGYLRESVTDPERADSCRSLISRSISTGSIMYQECDEDACSAFMDFNIREFLETAHGPAGR
jgi:hypothetical protein